MYQLFAVHPLRSISLQKAYSPFHLIILKLSHGSLVFSVNPTSHEIISESLNERGNMPSARILIVEDERQTVDTLRDLFEQHGYETEVALNKQVALTILQERSMDIAIVSTSVQDSSGGDILHEVRRLNANMPVIMISDHKSKRVEASSIKAGAKIFLLKPLDYVFVLQTIENLLEARFAIAIPKKIKKYSKSKK